MSSTKVNQVVFDENVKNAVFNAVGCEVKIINYKIRPYSKEKEGAVAMHYALKVNYTLSNSPQVQVYNFFLKAAHSLDPQNPETSLFEESAVSVPFSREVDFFNKIVPSMLRHLKSDAFAPKCWLAVEHMLFFEDLGLTGYSMSKKIFQDYENMKCVLSSLARFHASSLLAEAELEKPLIELYPDVCKDLVFIEHEKSMSGFLGTTLNMIRDLAKRFDLECPDMDEVHTRLTEAVKPLPNKINVICHGDLHRNNYMFNDNNSCNCIIVDYQVLRYTTPAIDLIMMLYINCTSELRQTRGREFVEHYYSVFCKTLEQSDMKIKIPKFEDISQAYEDYKFFGPVFSAMYLPGMLQPEAFKEMLSDNVSFKKYIFETRMEFLTPHLDNDPKFENAMKDMIEEFIELFQ